MSSAVVERAAAAAEYWARPCRREDDAILGSVAGLSRREQWAVVDLLAAGAFRTMSDDDLLSRMTELAAKAREPERKIYRGGETKTAALAEPLTDLGTFDGYLAAFGKDHGGDTIAGPPALADTVAEFNAGRIVWLLTDAHSEYASDVVARVTAAVVDGKGLRIAGEWMPTGRAQQLRAMVKAGAKLGLSIDYFPTATRPDGMGGRLLEKVTVVGGAITPKPMHPLAMILDGKSGRRPARIVTVAQNTIENVADPDRDRRRRMAAVVAASWLSPALRAALSVEDAYSVVEGAAAAKAAREAAPDEAARRQRTRRDRDNAYSNAMAAWRGQVVDCGHHSCMVGRCVYR